MAHIVSSEVLKAGFESRPIKTESGETLKSHTLEDVEFILRLLAYNNSAYSRTARELEREYGLMVHHNTLRRWVGSLFTQRYVQIQHELSEQISKKLGARFVDIAAKAAEAQDKALDQTLDALDRTGEDGGIQAASLPSAVQKLASAQGSNIQDAQLLADRPTQIIKHENPDEALKFLRERGLLKEETIDVEVVSEVDSDNTQ